MDFGSLAEGPLLKVVFLLFCIGIITRIVFFISSIIKGSQTVDKKGPYFFLNFIRFFIPFYRAVPKKPLYASLRYVFHFCLFVVPIWLAGHISLWEESTLEWYWISLPQEWADWMTLIVLALALFFIIRHVVVKNNRMNTSVSDYVIIVIAALPFLTGYFLTHGTLDAISFFSDKIYTMHIVSGELMIVATIFLFCRTRMNIRTCTGCASCVLSCPTGTLESEDTGHIRAFHYSHYQCICCASCVYTCPENAAELRHEISLKRLLQITKKQEIRSVEMEACQKCGALYVPEPLMDKIQKTFAHEYLGLCSNCRKESRGDYLKSISPWHRTMKSHSA
jgi:NAD-dependent dihydropyrimidine dehydrogenase PreA subunit